MRPFGPEELYAWLFRNYKSLYRRRLDVVKGVFYTLGTDQKWRQGCLVDDHMESLDGRDIMTPKQDLARYETDMRRLYQDIYNRLPPEKRKFTVEALVTKKVAEYAALPIGPVEDYEGWGTNFPRLSERYSPILSVPDDVREDWLRAAYEAALVLRDRAQAIYDPDDDLRMFYFKNQEEADDLNRHHQEAGTRIVQDLERRFGDRLKR